LEYIKTVSAMVETNRDKFIGISNALWGFAETKFEEFQSADLLCKTLEQEGFRVERGVANIETAFIASYGTGKPVIGILGEYDALSGLSQLGSIPEKTPIVDGGNGHGCGHNLLGTGSLAAAITLRHYMEQNRIQGTIRFYGCPAEEGGSGKAFMARERVFHDLDLALTFTLHIMKCDDIIAQAREELSRRLAGNIYVCPIPPDVKPSAKR
jgi:aminobenzoyl-glutamate utilization protein B